MAEILGDVRAASERMSGALAAAVAALADLESEVEDADSGWDAYDSSWDRAAALHLEAHDPKTPFVFCQEQTCVDLKDALRPGWRESRP